MRRVRAQAPKGLGPTPRGLAAAARNPGLARLTKVPASSRSPLSDIGSLSLVARWLWMKGSMGTTAGLSSLGCSATLGPRVAVPVGGPSPLHRHTGTPRLASAHRPPPSA